MAPMPIASPSGAPPPAPTQGAVDFALLFVCGYAAPKKYNQQAVANAPTLLARHLPKVSEARPSVPQIRSVV